MEKGFYSPLNLDIYVYDNILEYATSKWLPFGEVTGVTDEDLIEMAEAEICELGYTLAYIYKGKTPELHIYVDPICDSTEIMETIGHELGHLQPNCQFFWFEEKKANFYSEFIDDVIYVSLIVNNLISARKQKKEKKAAKKKTTVKKTTKTKKNGR